MEDHMPNKEKTDQERRQAFSRVLEVVNANRTKLMAIPGVLNVRPGYRFKNGWITTEPVITVTVSEKKPLSAIREQDVIPAKVEGVPVDVRPASPLQKLRATGTSQHQAAALAGPGAIFEEELALPGWDLKPPQSEAVPIQMELKDGGYKPPSPEVITLQEVNDEMNVTCCVSPEQGWPRLQEFLNGVTETLTIAMYDFTAPHITDALQAAMEPERRKLSLILDPRVALPSARQRANSNKADDITEDEIELKLEKVLEDRFDFVWAAVASRGKVAQGLFPNAYHIKVAVRDGKAFWLSSGNWQSSNQPPLAELGLTIGQLQQRYNREWHVIVEHKGLAKTYEKFIQYDMEQAKPLQEHPSPEEALAMPEAVTGLDGQVQVQFAPKRYEAHKSKRFEFTNGEKLKVMPLLTPDNYADNILRLIQTAKERIWFQNQYIKIKENADQKFTNVVDALLEKMNDGVDVRIILRNEGDVGSMLEALQYQGFDMDKVRLQLGCHNKGIIVDSNVPGSEIVVVGSHNWSSDGVVHNRDASLIFYNGAIASYFADVFQYDWDTLAHQRALSEVAPSDLAAPTGASTNVAIPWSDLNDD
jgi:PLD-like domain